MAGVFINASTARSDTRNASVIHAEVCAIESAVLANVDAGVLNATVTGGTTMTDSNEYYNAYFNITDAKSSFSYFLREGEVMA